ncbi:D-alanyl-D-alanine carboxypeptidase/D-alanyl-D-alanine-endopeptidase [Mucilaginibacter boryungensis]|uniref:D-alanyl-D-alanine carboxypeptidase n=1 Tax=Mucilaginibacter boryungensis TaxID=768480 RepID=A0ABR9XM21_9SPHI|nr:D-alanyl-D-alanine carboxypeptidase [Mucilaginibacter boryungensis]MBE9668417.1 D-alanyl-D-alanine carboxypeptidase [Mucilaginibacter boryungensis]
MRISPSFIILILAALFFQSCKVQSIQPRKIKKLFNESKIVNDHFTGFALYDLDKQQMIYELNDDKYYTPASNTKLFTFYTCLRMLGDSIPALQYITRGDSLIFWGTGDPSFLHSDLKGTKGLEFLKNSNKNLYFSSGRYTGGFWGSGWPWNDYNDYYQADITELPMQDNVTLITTGADGKPKMKPVFLAYGLQRDNSYHPRSFNIQRNFADNTFVYPDMPMPKNFKQEIPWKTSPALTLAMLQDTLKKPVTEIHMPIPRDAKTIYNANADSVYRRMLQPSDNFIAEQLLLVCSSVKFGVLNKDSVINYSVKNYLNDLPDVPQWADGSGLSRFDLFTPRSIVKLLVKIQEQIKDERFLHSLMPIGGVAGTIRNAYKTDNGVPFVWAKTGTLANNHNQSGYLVTRKGKRLAFSFMNNNFTRPTGDIRGEMVRIMTYIHENY